LYRFIHEYKTDFWERADMRKIGEYTPQEEAKLRQIVAKRKEGGPIFNMD
jgi:hypothetical protein